MTEHTDAAERLALTLTRHGLQRMTGRVLAMLLFSDQDTVTAGELADRLAASPSSVSTAIKTLTAAGLVERVPAPGSRREHFRVPDEGWATLMSAQNTVVQEMQAAATAGIEFAGEDSIAGRRLANMRDFYAHLMRELPAVIDRWRAGRAP
jgi:DNA-binding transcriptional regulator GbsR (MarR family)